MSIDNAVDKRQITLVLAVTATGEYLTPHATTIQKEDRKMPSASGVSREMRYMTY